MFWKAGGEAYLCYYLFCPTLVFCRLEKIFCTFIIITWELIDLINLIMEIWFNYTLTLYQVHSCFVKLLEINIFPPDSNQPSSLPLELISMEGENWLQID